MNTVHVRIKLKTPLFLILVIILLVIKIFDPYQGWTILLIGLGGAFVISWIWAYSLSRGLRLEREMRFGWVQVGDRMEERFNLVNRGIFPALWVQVDDHTNMPGYQASCATGVGGNTSNSWITEGVCEKRGQFTHGPLTLHTSDPFTLFNVEIHDPRTVQFMVLPPIVAIKKLKILPSGWGGEEHPKTYAPIQTISAAGVRPFLPGDSLHSIHWRTSARRDELYVRIFDGNPAGNWLIVVDMDLATQVGSGLDSTIEYSIILAASLAMEGLYQDRAIALSINAEQSTWIPSRHGVGQRWDILRSLALASPSRYDLNQFLPTLSTKVIQHFSLMIITANTNPNWLRALLSFDWKSNTPMVLCLDPQSFGGTETIIPLTGQLAQLGIPFQVIPKEFLDQTKLRPGKAGQRQWRVTPLGRAISQDHPESQEWRSFS
jgi:uncharacterized protein (DUF58 family)